MSSSVGENLTTFWHSVENFYRALFSKSPKDSEIPLDLGKSTMQASKKLRRKSRNRKKRSQKRGILERGLTTPRTPTPTYRTHLNDRKRVKFNQGATKVASSVCKRLEESQFSYIDEKLYARREAKKRSLHSNRPV